MVVIVHHFDRDFSAHVVESWLDYYLPYAELKSLLVPRHHQHQRWALLRRLLPRRVLAVLPGLSTSPSQQQQQRTQTPPLGSQQQRRTSASHSAFFSPASPPPRKEAPGEGYGPSSSAAPPPIASGAGDTPGSPSRASTAPTPPAQQQRWPMPTKDSTMRFAAAAAKSALALATPGPTGAGSSGAHGAGATTSSSTPSTSRLSPSPSVSSVRSAMDGPTMQDLGRSDSLERFGSIGGGGALDLGDLGSLMQGGSPEAREVLAQQPFLEAFKQAADRCNGFFVQESDRLAGECAEALRQLQEAERALAALGKHKGASAANLRAGEVWAEIKAVYKHLHREVKELRSFSRTNFDLAIRLVKHYRKAVGRSSRVAGAMWRYLRALELTDDRRLYALTQALEQQYAEAFSFGFVGLAHKELYAQTGSDFHVFRVGLRFGGAVVLLAWVLWNALADSSEGVNLFRHPIINVYAAVGGVLLLGWTWALNLAVWERAGVDYRSILHFKTPMTSVEAVFAEVSTASTVYLANLLLYYKLLRGVAGPFQAVPSLLLPILLVAYFMYKAFFPWEQRREIWEILAQIVIAPFGKVEFVHLYFADTMTSFNKVSYETVMGMCYMVQQEYIDDHRGGISGTPISAIPPSCGPNSIAQKYIAPLVIAYPLWLRLLQSLKRYYQTSKRVPPLPNAIKYGLSLSVVLFALFNPEYARDILNNEDKHVTAFKVFWVISYTLTTVLTWLWDVKMDWGLFEDRHTGLRPHLLFRRHRWVYYLAIVADLLLRFLWTVSLLPEATVGSLAYFQLRVRFLTPLLELLRRSMWAWLRLEREQSIRDEQEGLFLAAGPCMAGAAGGVEEAKRRKRACRNKQERARRLARIREEVAQLTKTAQLLRSRHGSTRASRVTLDGSTSRSGVPGVGGWDEDVDEEGAAAQEMESEEDEDEDEEVLEAQKVMQKDLVSQRSVVMEVGLVLGFFVGIAVWAARDH